MLFVHKQTEYQTVFAACERERDCCQKKRISQKLLLRDDGDRADSRFVSFRKAMEIRRNWERRRRERGGGPDA